MAHVLILGKTEFLPRLDLTSLQRSYTFLELEAQVINYICSSFPVIVMQTRVN